MRNMDYSINWSTNTITITVTKLMPWMMILCAAYSTRWRQKVMLYPQTFIHIRDPKC